jgi:hypothetical protein
MVSEVKEEAAHIVTENPQPNNHKTKAQNKSQFAGNLEVVDKCGRFD